MSPDLLSRRHLLALAASGSAAALLPMGAFAQQQPAGANKPATAVPPAGGKPPLTAKPKVKPAATERTAWYAACRPVILSFDVAPEQYESLVKEPKKYVTATMREVGGKTYKDVGLKLRGSAGSFRPINEKPGLTVNVDKFTKGQMFHGLDKFHLNNCMQDPSFFSEAMAGEIHRACGVPAARCNHAAVQLNGRTLGFYMLKEGYDAIFLEHHFGNNDGNFYDGGFLRDIDQELEVDLGKDGMKDRADLKALLAAATQADHGKRIAEMEKVVDLAKFCSYLACMVFTWDWDGYAMKRNNYRIYAQPDGKCTFIPSGMDQLLGEPNGPLIPNFEGVVARNFVETAEGRKRYIARMNELLGKIFPPPAILRRLDEHQARIQPALKVMDAKAAADYPGQVNRWRDAIKQRFKTLGDQLRTAK